MTDAGLLSGEGTAGAGVGRDTLVVSVCTLLSRLTGFARVLVAAAVLSNGLLGDTYHAANTVPNLVFELVAGGVLQAFLVPTFVAARREGGDDELGRTAGVVVSVLSIALGLVALVLMLAAPLITDLLVADDGQPAVVADKRAVMTPMLLVFLPQILFYGVGMVTTAALAARHRFAAAALAPAVNNAVVITFYLLYWRSRSGELASLDLDTGQFWMLAGGTTLAVIAFTAVPGVVLRAQGVRWRPRWDLDHPAVSALKGSIGWAVLSVAGTLVPTAAAIVLGFRVEGGVAVFAMTWAFFVLPHALVAVPIATAVSPRVADAWQRRDLVRTGQLIDRAARTVVPLLLLGGAGMITLAWPVARVASSFGQAASQGVAPIAHALAAFGFGLVGYGMSFTMVRVLFSLGEVKRASVLVAVSSLFGVVAMILVAMWFPDGDRAAALALGYGFTQTLSALLLTAGVRRVTGAPTISSIGRITAGAAGAAVVAGGLMYAVQGAFAHSVVASAAAIVVAGATGCAVFVLVVGRLLGVSLWQLIGRDTGG